MVGWSLHTYSKAHVTQLSSVKAIELKITSMYRDQNEAQCLGNLLIEAKKRSDVVKGIMSNSVISN